MSANPIDLDKSSHIRFSKGQYDIVQQRLKNRERDKYLDLANSCEMKGNIDRAFTLREVALGMLPREWATLH